MVASVAWPRGSTPGKTNPHAPQPAVWSADKERQPLPVSGDAERPLPNARRDVPSAPKRLSQNAFKHGHYTAEAIATRREIAKLLRDARALVKQVVQAMTSVVLAREPPR